MKMKRETLYILLSLLLLLVVGCANLVQDEPETAVTPDELEDANSPNTEVVDEIDDEEETAVLPAQEDLPLLPQFEGTQAQGLGGGGEGLINERIVAESASLAPANAIDADFGLSLYYGDVFSGTTFVLNGTLPTDIVREIVQQQTPTPMSLEEASQVAAAFGFTNSLYKNPAFTFVDEAGVEQVENVPTTYYAFDGMRMLNIDSFGIYYQDGSFSYDYTHSYDHTQQSELEQLAPNAEAFLLFLVLLTFEYTIERIWGNDIGFYRQVNGRSLDQPEITVSLNQNGDVVSVGIQPLNHLETLGNYPLRSAAEA